MDNFLVRAESNALRSKLQAAKHQGRILAPEKSVSLQTSQRCVTRTFRGFKESIGERTLDTNALAPLNPAINFRLPHPHQESTRSHDFVKSEDSFFQNGRGVAPGRPIPYSMAKEGTRVDCCKRQYFPPYMEALNARMLL